MELVKSKILSTVPGIVVILLFTATPVWAVQSHSGTEGLVAHQIGHVLFAGGMAYLLFSLHRIKLENYDWFEFKTFLWLIIAWNFLTFSGHVLSELVDKSKFVFQNGELTAFNVENFTDAWFFLSQLDHLLLLPSFVFLLLALQKWGRQG